MSTPLEQIRDQQQTTWDKFSAGWRKWDAMVLPWLAPVGTEMIEESRLRADSLVLDIASGTGEPGLSAAAKCPNGKVTITDLSEKMLQVAQENAARRGLRNVEARQCDAGALPFPDATFDAVLARFGFMFFPDIPVAAREFARVAKPGARVCASVWGDPGKNSWATTTMSAIAKQVETPPPPPGTPGLFRCAAPGFIAGVFREAGLKNVTEKTVAGQVSLDSPDQYFTFMSEVVAPVAAALAKTDEATRSKIKALVTEAAAKTVTAGKVRLDWSAVVICGEK